jgi:uncharacterized protein (DUF1800 family)
MAFSAALLAKKREAKSPQMDGTRRALHALNRLTFGPRPGDVDRVAAMGVDKWIELQLHPEKIDDRALDAHLSPFRTLKMDTRAMLENFPPPQVAKAVENGRMSLPRDPAKRAIVESEIARQEERKERKADAADPQNGAADQNMREERREMRQQAEARMDSFLALSPDARYKMLLGMQPDERRALNAALTPEERESVMKAFTPQQRETVQALFNPQSVIVNELQEAKILRAAYSERQLDEVMTDFWFNHFNVFLNKGEDRYLVTSYERDVIRPHALGKFKDLLAATAKSPAMLFYLDNWLSIGPDSDQARGVPRRQPGLRTRRVRGPFGPEIVYLPPRAPRRPPNPKAKKNNSGLNENYGRELMELHTLGVNGGYTQRDVTEVAKVFTGWTIKQPREGGTFFFDERRHEPGTKYVLGHKIKENGEKEGMQVLAILAHHPSTARFISTKLAQRFVSDDPPTSLVNRMAETFLKRDGDIREVLRTMFHSPEFWSDQSYRAKVKTPLEFVASAIRATGADVENPMPLVQALNRMGMPLYQMQPPTGYSTKADAWVNSAALLNRMNFALQLATGRLAGAKFDPQQLVQGPEPPVDAQGMLGRLERSLLAGDISVQTHETILKQLDSATPEAAAQAKTDADAKASAALFNDPKRGPNVAVLTALILGSPEFQRR